MISVVCSSVGGGERPRRDRSFLSPPQAVVASSLLLNERLICPSTLKRNRSPGTLLRAMRLKATGRQPPSPYPRSWRRLYGAAVSLRWPALFVGAAPREPCVVRQVERRTRKSAMRPLEIGIAERTEEIAWRHVWLKSVLIDAGNPFPTKIYRSRPTRRMSVTRRLEKLHRIERPSDRSDLRWQDSLLAAMYLRTFEFFKGRNPGYPICRRAKR